MSISLFAEKIDLGIPNPKSEFLRKESGKILSVVFFFHSVPGFGNFLSMQLLKIETTNF